MHTSTSTTDRVSVHVTCIGMVNVQSIHTLGTIRENGKHTLINRVA